MSACKHYNTQGYYRCALKMQKPCHECGQFEAALHGATFQTNAIDADTMIGDHDTNRDKVSGYAINVNKPTEDTIVPDTDMVNSPAHYAGHYPVEVKELIEVCLEHIQIGNTLTPWDFYCLGNELKYRLRAGLKGDAAQDIAKSMVYAGYRKDV